jgi:hypothetical protein
MQSNSSAWYIDPDTLKNSRRLPIRQFYKKHIAHAHHVVSSSIGMIYSSMCEMGYMDADKQSQLFMKQVFYDIIVHGICIFELDKEGFTSWIKQIKFMLEDGILHALKEVEAYSAQIDVSEEEALAREKAMREQIQADDDAVLHTLGRTSRDIRHMFSVYDMNEGGSNGLFDDINETIWAFARARSDVHRAKARANALLKVSPKKGEPREAGDSIYVTPDSWQHVFSHGASKETGGSMKRDPGHLPDLVRISRNFFKRVDPMHVRVMRRRKKVSDTYHPIWKHCCYSDGHVYYVQGRMCIPIITDVMDHNLNIETPCLIAYPLVVRDHMMEETERTISAHNSSPFVLMNSVMSAEKDLLRSALTEANVIRQEADNYFTDSSALDNFRAGVGTDEIEANVQLQAEREAHKLSDTLNQQLESFQEVSSLQNQVRERLTELSKAAMGLSHRRVAPREVTEDFIQTFGEEERITDARKGQAVVRNITGHGNIQQVTAGKRDPNWAAKAARNDMNIHLVFQQPKTSYDPTAGTKASTSANNFFENNITAYMKDVIMVINTVCSLLGLPVIDVSLVKNFTSRDGDRERQIAKADTEVLRGQVQLQNLKVQNMAYLVNLANSLMKLGADTENSEGVFKSVKDMLRDNLVSVGVDPDTFFKTVRSWEVSDENTMHDGRLKVETVQSTKQKPAKQTTPPKRPENGAGDDDDEDEDENRRKAPKTKESRA